jgi:hypothetical protein
VNAESLIWAAAEFDAIPEPVTTMPSAVREYLAAWLETPKHGCGHPGELRFSFDADSVVCGECATRIGLTAWSQCSQCTTQLRPGNYVTNAALAVGRYVVIVSLCSTCAPDPKEEP